MELRHLPLGERADPDCDRVAITTMRNGRFGFVGTVGAAAARVGLVGPNLFASEEAALAAACAWSAAQGVEQLVVERSRL